MAILWFAGLIALAAADSTCPSDEPVSALQHSKRTVALVDPLGAGAEDPSTNKDDTLTLQDASIEDTRGQGGSHVVRVKLDYVLLMEKNATYGGCVFEESVTTGFTVSRSTASTVDARLTTKVEAAVYSVAASAEATLGVEFTSEFSIVQTTTSSTKKKFTCDNNHSFYVYQAMTCVWFVDTNRACYGGALSATNHPRRESYTKELDATDVVEVESFMKGQMRYYSYPGHSVYYNLPYHGWTRDPAVGFYAFKKPQGGTFPVDVWRKGEIAYYLLNSPHSHFGDSWMWQHHWRLESRAVFYAYHFDQGPHDAVEVHSWRKGQIQFLITPDYVHFNNIGRWGWRHEFVAFKVPKFGL